MEGSKAVAVKEPEQLSLEDIKKYIAPGATDKELFMFMNISRAYNLSPVKREIHFIKYGGNAASIVVGYETYIKRAERTGLLDGWSVELDKDELGQKAIITIHRKDRGKPFVWTVYRSEFDSQQANWKKMPLFMLRKVAISQGFRLAFPEELGGMPYSPEELVQTSGTTSEQLPQNEPEVLEPEPNPVTERLLREIDQQQTVVDMDAWGRKNATIIKSCGDAPKIRAEFAKRKNKLKAVEAAPVEETLPDDFGAVKVFCPELDAEQIVEFCNAECTKREGCPAHAA